MNYNVFLFRQILEVVYYQIKLYIIKFGIIVV